jgi:sulfur relay (sulfurtransferase) DsrF/TusC family protein
MVESILTIVHSAPYGREDAFAGLRFNLSQIAAGMMDEADSLLVEDGVWNAVTGQDADVIRMPSNEEATEDLTDLDGKVYVVREDMEERALTEDMLLDEVTIISRADVAALIDQYDAFATY